MYKLLYIDEDKEQIDNFLNYIDDTNNNKNFEIIPLFPLGEIDEMIDAIFKINPDVIVCDFLLNENIGDLGYNIPYNGVELVEEFLNIRDKFPCFVLTAKDKEAVSDSEDVNLVYTKSLMTTEIIDTKAKLKFADRLIKQIEHYKQRIKDWEDEFNKLLELKKQGKASVFDESRLIVLDSLLENTIDKKNSFPDEFKTISNIDKLDDLINDVDKLINKIDRNGK